MQPSKENSALEGAALVSHSQHTPSSKPSQELYRSAISIASRGKPVFPLIPKGKKPVTEHGLKDASTNTAKIKEWWEQYPAANIGMVTGWLSGTWVLDIDGEEGEESLRALIGRHGELPQTAESITGGGGRHIFFLCPKALTISNSAGRLGAGIDVRANGGYVVMPPSIHESGKKYAWSVDSGNQMSHAPEWLLRLINKPQDQKEVTPPNEWRDLVKGVGEGKRNHTLSRLAGHLLRRYIDPFVTLELCHSWNEARCKPPMPPDEVARTVDSIAARELTRRGGK